MGGELHATFVGGGACVRACVCAGWRAGWRAGAWGGACVRSCVCVKSSTVQMQ